MLGHQYVAGVRGIGHENGIARPVAQAVGDKGFGEFFADQVAVQAVAPIKTNAGTGQGVWGSVACPVHSTRSPVR